MNNVLNVKVKNEIINSIIEFSDRKIYYLIKTGQLDIDKIRKFIPLSTSHCYFCRLSTISLIVDCNKCAYKLIHGICSVNNSDYHTLCTKLNNIKINKIDTKKLFEIYDKYINKLSKSRTVNSFMSNKRDMIIEIVKLVENDENKNEIKKAIILIKRKYWNSRKDIKI